MGLVTIRDLSGDIVALFDRSQFAGVHAPPGGRHAEIHLACGRSITLSNVEPVYLIQSIQTAYDPPAPKAAKG